MCVMTVTSEALLFGQAFLARSRFRQFISRLHLFNHHPGETALQVPKEVAGRRQEVLIVVTLELDYQVLVPNDALSLISDVFLS
jgi:hypothetical protein